MRIFCNNFEITKEVERYDSKVYLLNYNLGDYIYIASDFPFNHIYFKMGAVKNTGAAGMKVEYYSTSWNEVVELRDDTEGLTKDGFIEFTPNRNFGWAQAVDSSLTGQATVVYYKYWTRISFDDSLSADIELSFVGNKFSDDEDLFSEFPVFNDANFLSAFKSGKTSWEEQHIKAAELIIQDLQKKQIIIAKEQILDRKKFIGASTYKTAEIIFTAFGNDYQEQRKIAKEEYSKRLDLSQYSVDLNASGAIEPNEIYVRSGWMSR